MREMLETCPICGQPDNCGDCTHEPVSSPRVEDWTTAEIARPEKCDFCDKDAEYDAATNYLGRQGPWAYFCEDHFQTHSIRRLGLGLGQRLVVVGGE